MRSLSILIFAGYYLPYRGGYIESLHGLAKGLVQAGHTVTIVTGNVTDSPVQETIDGVEVFRLPTWHWLGGTYPVIVPGLKTFRTLRRLKRRGVDLVSTQTRFFVSSFLGTYFSVRHRIPQVHTERGAYHSVVEKRWVDWMSRLIDHTLGALVVKISKRNVGVSQAAADFLKHLGARNVVRIPNGVDLIPNSDVTSREGRLGHRIEPIGQDPTGGVGTGEASLRKAWDVPQDTHVLLFVGRLIYGKGAQDVLEILPQLLKKNPSLQFCIAGDGPYRKALEDQVKSRELTQHVRFLGLLEGDQVIEWLQIADTFVNPSHSEGLPRSVLEAAAAGLPIVATDVGGTAEIVQDNKTGFLVPPQSPEALHLALEKILNDRKQAEAFGTRVRAHIAEHFTWSKVVRSYIDLFRELV